ncbi:hypothetical protein Mterra_02244 [Calidithermus terrae]|uniref:Uncharacterized protein n=1 Tax=Calidithermus terrae TaxID=1408545 RepID=A0A399EG16_9DEIN|nr:hypothetical protein [Calidithermus terrae]RIH83587.1 hypothetical protein Mterra_02244 [Calidithermus terrae]
MDTPRAYLVLANLLIWLPPLVSALGPGSAFVAALALGCIMVSLVALWVGVVGSIRQGRSAANLPLMAVYGVGAVVSLFLARSLSP